MKATTEMELKISGGRILSAKVEDGVCRLLIEVAEEKVEPDSEVKEIETVSVAMEDDDLFVCIKASELSLDDEFMQHKPNGEREQKLKDALEAVIKKGILDFWRPRMDPSFDKKGNICFKAGEKPAVGNSYNWWRDNAKKFNPKRRSRLGTKSQYIAFLGVLIKTLVAEDWDIAEAWDAVCNDSEKLGHYWNSENAKHAFEPTGSRAIVGFYDLANTCKILAEDEEAGGFWLAGGYYGHGSNNIPLAVLGHYGGCNNVLSGSVGWLVLS